MGSIAWWQGNSKEKSYPVGQKQSNELGIYDMTGNVAEWCSDWYGDSYYSSGPSNNPKGPSSGLGKILRGGHSGSSSNYCRYYYRDYILASGEFGVLPGLRLVLPY